MRSSRLKLEQVADPDNLRRAFVRAARGKSHREEVQTFRLRLDEELNNLRMDILSGEVAVGSYASFTIFEPKERRIHAPCFRERVLHHALLAGCEDDFERWSIFDSYACRRGKGREAALHRAELYARRYDWFLKLDVSKYFDSIPHQILLQEIERRFCDKRVSFLWRRIVGAYSTEPGRGLPIGALTSQHLANFYLSPVDRLVRESLRLPGYVRYMDDMALWGKKEDLKLARMTVESLLAEQLGLRLKGNWHLQPTKQGMQFLGYRIFANGSCLARSSRKRFLRRWAWIERAREEGGMDDGDAQRCVLSMTAFVRVARREPLLGRLFGQGMNLGTGYRAPTASIAVAVGGTMPRTAGRPTGTTTPRAIATTTWASGPP
jgi:RNA-directed DNA polymerase